MDLLADLEHGLRRIPCRTHEGMVTRGIARIRLVQSSGMLVTLVHVHRVTCCQCTAPFVSSFVSRRLRHTGCSLQAWIRFEAQQLRTELRFAGIAVEDVQVLSAS